MFIKTVIAALQATLIFSSVVVLFFALIHIRIWLVSFAEDVSVSENVLVLIPASVILEEAATVTIAEVTALQALRDKGQIIRLKFIKRRL